MKIYTSLLLLCILVQPITNAYAQTVSGKLADTTGGTPLPYATVSLLDSLGKPVSGVITKDDGAFVVGPVKPGKYTLQCRMIGYQQLSQKLQLSARQHAVLGTLYLLPDNRLLKEVAVTGDKPALVLLPDKKVFEVGKDVLSQNGSVSDVLNGIPSVNVSPQGQVTLRGNPGVIVLINGRRSGLVQGNALEQLQAGQVERVEVISSPSARYDASGTGGVINIILKKNRKTGFNGQVQVMAGVPNDTRLNPSLNYKSEKFNFFSTLGLRKSDYKGLYASDQLTQLTSVAMRQHENRHDDGKMLYTGIDYQLSEKRSMTVAYLRNSTHDHDKTGLDYNYGKTSTDSTLKRNGESRERRSYSQLEYNYTQTFARPKKKWTIDLQYDWWNSIKDWQLLTDKVLPEAVSYPAITTRTGEANRDLLSQSDWVQPLNAKDLQLEAGLKTEHRSVNYNFLIAPGPPNELRYRESIQGAYTQLSNKHGKWSYLVGLRAELTGIRINNDIRKSYAWFFPTAHLNYALKPDLTLQAHYSTRIRRPSLYSLSPFAELTDLTSRNTGNPNLNPSYAQVFELGMLRRTARFTINPTFFFQHIGTPTADYTYRNAEGIYTTLPVNLASEQRGGVELNVMWNPVKALQLNADFNVYRFRQTGKYNGFDFAFSGGSSGGRLTAQVKLPWATGFQTRYYYNGPVATAQSRLQALHWTDLGLSKKLFNDRLSLALDVTNVLDTRRYRTTVTDPDYSLVSMSRFNGARFRLSLTCKIGNNGVVRQAKTGNRN
ncbi:MULTISPECIES: TonB-dependent receptor domain-containing protein [Niastella]|uniref:TonB-dependent receptor n=1 Tax=Niastella soli TaxID=2821487 RepID=A0ABS3Z3L6_9BACT|nr:TonB-dependent receptor [Niastella soli]MBO9204327.1 TonB-dependent receptor [Niastella soli]